MKNKHIMKLTSEETCSSIDSNDVSSSGIDLSEILDPWDLDRPETYKDRLGMNGYYFISNKSDTNKPENMIFFKGDES